MALIVGICIKKYKTEQLCCPCCYCTSCTCY